MKMLLHIIAGGLALATALPAARAQVAGSLDPSFNAAVSGATVQATAVQPDGKIVLAGSFSSVGGQARNNIARLEASGAVESAATFNPGTGANGWVNSAVLQADGKILLAGAFSAINGQPRSQLARLHADGTLESTATFNSGTGTNGNVKSIAVQADGKILVVGDFTAVNGQARNRIARLHADGSLESTATFNPGTGVNGPVSAVAVQADGRILLGGLFARVNDHTRNNLARLNADGTVESSSTFNPGAGPDNEVWNVALQADGRILIGGVFLKVNGQARARIARLNPDGTVENTATFNPGTGANDFINCLAVQANGKILLGGAFTSVNGQTSDRIARLNADGTLESTTTFDPGIGTDNNVWSIALQADGMILLAGPFYSVNGQERSLIARLGNDTATQSLTISSSAEVQWVRGGAAPEIEQVTFELSTDGGVNWRLLATGTRISGGWEPTGLSLPAGGLIRARGRTTAGLYLGSSGLVEQVASFAVTPTPEIAVERPAGSDLADGASVAFPAVLGAGTSRTFTIKNLGYADLDGLGIMIDGPDATLFTVTASPTPVVGPNGSTTFHVQFTHTSAGPRTATLRLASNDADENPFELVLNGRDPFTNADLTNLGLNAGTLTPAFAAATTSYTATVPASTASLRVSPITADATATVQVNGMPVASGSASDAIALSVGSNLLTIVVTAEDAVTTKTYAVTVTRNATSPGPVDASFNPVVDGVVVQATTVQPDGKIVLAGLFSSVDGQTRNNIARLHADGTLESTATFNPGTGADGWVYGAVVQADGKILLAGAFTAINGQARRQLARLHANGTLESTATFNPATGTNGNVKSIAVQPDGKILVVGDFTTVNGQARRNIARLNANGTVESTTTFNVGTGVNGPVSAVAVQADGKILLGGLFTSVNGQTRRNLARLNTNGTVESTATFNPGSGPDNEVWNIAVQADGKILFGGFFLNVNGQARSRLARLNPSGTVESTTTFNAGTGANDFINCIAVQTDGKILLGGAFTSIDGQTRNRIARLNADGTLESTATFDPGVGTNNNVWSVALQADGKILLAGPFNSVDGQARAFIALLSNDAATQSLTVPSGTQVQWARGGTAPEVEQVTFELSTNGGASWSSLGAGTRIADGWERTGLALPISGTIRARGRTTAGLYMGSSGLVEQITAFTGTGQTRLESWRLTYFGSPANSGRGANGNDDDHDGSVNVLEFATHRDPTQPGGGIGTLSINGTVLEFRYQRATAAVLDGLTFAVEWSDTLGPGSWSRVGVSESVSGDGPVQEILATVPAGAVERFVRLRVDAP